MELIPVLSLFAGLAFLIKGSDLFVRSAASIARRLGVSELVIGLTLVSVGTSIPEYASAIMSSILRQSDLITGNIVGANISNICLVTGAAAVYAGMKMSRSIAERDSYILLISSVLFYITVQNGVISAGEGLLFLSLYGTYILFLLESSKDETCCYKFSEFAAYFFKLRYISTIKNGLIRNSEFFKDNLNRIRHKKLNREPIDTSIIKDFLTAAVGGILVYFGADYLIQGAVYAAEAFEIPKTVLGVILSIGTTLPELSVSVVAARKGFGDISIGNVVGSCITNILLIIGTAAIINPINISGMTLNYTVPVLVFVSFVLFYMVKAGPEIRRAEGVILLVLYALFMIFLIKNPFQL
jgi:cation:H+ antiporter